MKHLKKTMAATLITAGIIGVASVAIADNDKNDHLLLQTPCPARFLRQSLSWKIRSRYGKLRF